MIKIYMQDRSLRGAQLIKKSSCGEIYRLQNGNFFKLFNPVLRAILNQNYSLERKIMSARPISDVPEIIVPTAGVFNMQNKFVGYITPPAEGVDFNTYDQDYTLEQRSNLNAYGELFYNMSSAVERANKHQIVFPDLCTCDNIFVSGGKVSFIDYDGLQVRKHKVCAISSTLGDEFQYRVPKYMKGDLFTPELDKKSLVLLYFLTAFNIDLGRVGKVNPATGRVITLYEVFDLLGLQDYDFMQKVYNTLSPDKQGEYIGDDVLRIADEYDMMCLGPIKGEYYIKKLIKK